MIGVHCESHTISTEKYIREVHGSNQCLSPGERMMELKLKPVVIRLQYIQELIWLILHAIVSIYSMEEAPNP